jgi:hypothetical protein
MASKNEGKGKRAERILRPDPNTGWSSVVWMGEFEKRGVPRPNNGATWNRADSGYLGSRYVVKNYKERELPPELLEKFQASKEIGKGDSGGTVAVQLQGVRKNQINTAIRKDIRAIYETQPCVFTGMKAPKMQCDHKDGRKDDWRINKEELQQPEDFQSVTPAANVWKREQCNSCKRTQIRFDATGMGFSVPQSVGDLVYSTSCVGCYCYDPVAFRATVSRGFVNVKSLSKGK